MLWDASAIKGFTIEATDGPLGSVSDFLFDDDNWRIKWLVVDTGYWLPGRLVLIHPRALGKPDASLRQFPVTLTKQQVTDSPSIATDQPVSQQMEARLYDYYGWDPAWGETYFQSGAIASRLVPPPYLAGAFPHAAVHDGLAADGSDRHLRSMSALAGYHIHASDGQIGSASDFLIDDTNWMLRFVKIDTGNWLPGAEVLIAPSVVQKIDWSDNSITVSATRDEVKRSPKFDPSKTADGAYQQALLLELPMYYGF